MSVRTLSIAVSIVVVGAAWSSSAPAQDQRVQDKGEQLKKEELKELKKIQNFPNWQVGVGTGVLWSRAPDAVTDAAFHDPNRFRGDVWGSLELCNGRVAGLLRLDYVYEPSSVLTRFEGDSGQPGAQTFVLAHDLSGSFGIRWILRTPFIVRARVGLGGSFTTLQYASDADGRLFSETTLALHGVGAIGVDVKPARSFGFAFEGGYLLTTKSDLEFDDPALTFKYEDETFAKVDRTGVFVTAGIFFAF